jgi:ribonuclease P protein component
MSIQSPFFLNGYPAKQIQCCEKGTVLLKPFSFTKMERIRKSSEYRILSNCGARHYSNYFIIVSRENQILRSRLGITVSKKVGKAVTRNRIKRIIREYFRVNRSILPVQLDINVIARKASATIGNESLREKLGCLLNTMAKKYHPTA